MGEAVTQLPRHHLITRGFDRTGQQARARVLRLAVAARRRAITMSAVRSRDFFWSLIVVPASNKGSDLANDREARSGGKHWHC
jgi:hypothetical protein